MQPVKGRQIELAGHTVVGVDIATMLGNVFGAFCAGNRRSTFRSALRVETITELLTAANSALPRWFAGTKNSMIQLDTKAKISELDASIREFVEELTQLPEFVNDIGARLLSETAGCDAPTPIDDGLSWSCTYVVDPAVGYPRIYTKPGASSGVEKFDGTIIPNIHGTWSLSIAKWLTSIDRGTLTLSLMKPAGEMKGHDPRDQPFGQLFATIQQMQSILEWLTLMLVQGPCLYTHIHHRLNRPIWELAYMTERRARPALDAWWESYEFLESVPLHTLLTPIANALKTGTIDTPMGTRELIYLAGEDTEPPAHKAMLKTKGSYAQSRMTRVLNAALYDFGSSDTSELRWGVDAASAMPYLTIGTAARLIRSLGDISKRWDAISKELQWTRLSGDVGQIDARGADFILTDGKDYSAAPYGGLLGLRPVLSAGNVKLGGYAVRFEDDFNIRTGMTIRHSVMVVDGYQGATGIPSMYERSVMPASMLMGEVDVTRTYATTMLNDGIGTAAYNWYASKQTAYVDEFYKEVQNPTPQLLATPNLEITDWDSFGVAQNPRDASAAFLTYYDKQTRPFGDGMIVESESRFYHRFIVRSSRTTDLLQNYDPMWIEIDPVAQEGAVMFNGEVLINHSSADLEAIINALPSRVKQETSAPNPVSEQVTIKQ